MRYFVKQLDFFSSPITLSISTRNPRTGEVKYHSVYRSLFGFSLTLLSQVLCFVFLGYQVIRMYSLADDDYKSLQVANNFDTEASKILNLTKLGFLPNWSFRAEGSISEYDILKKGAVQDERDLDLDFQKLQRFVETNMIISTKEGGRMSHFVVPMVQCRPEWLQSLTNVPSDDKVSRLLCPDIDRLGDKWILEGGIYFEKRITIQAQFGLCNQRRTRNCESEAKTRQLLDLLVVTQNNVIGRVLLRNEKKPDALPISHINWYVQDFKLRFAEKMDHKNFLQLNFVKTQDERFNILAKAAEYTFVSSLEYGYFIDNRRKAVLNASTDGVKFEPFELESLYESNFFFGDTMFEHSRTFRNWIEILAEWGGLQRVVITAFVLVFKPLIERRKYAKMISKLLLVRKTRTELFNRHLVSFKLQNIVSDVFGWFGQAKTHKDDLYWEGKRQVAKSLDIVHINQSIQKMKASLAVLLGRQNQVVID